MGRTRHQHTRTRTHTCMDVPVCTHSSWSSPSLSKRFTQRHRIAHGHPELSHSHTPGHAHFVQHPDRRKESWGHTQMCIHRPLYTASVAQTRPGLTQSALAVTPPASQTHNSRWQAHKPGTVTSPLQPQPPTVTHRLSLTHKHALPSHPNSKPNTQTLSHTQP